MKLVTRLILSVVAVLAVTIASAQTFWGGVASPEPVSAYSDPVIRELHRDVRPRVWQLPGGRGILITIQAITTVDENATPAAADGALPESFRVERKGGTSTDFITVTTIANGSGNARGKLKYRDVSAVPNHFLHYRIVVVYPNGHEVALRESKRRHVDPNAYDMKLEASSVTNGIELSWRPVLWEADAYQVERSGGGSSIVIGTVDHDPGARRLSITDSSAVSGVEYQYELATQHASLGTIDFINLTVTAE